MKDLSAMSMDELFETFKHTESFWLQAEIMNEAWRRTLKRYQEIQQQCWRCSRRGDQRTTEPSGGPCGPEDPTIAYHCNLSGLLTTKIVK